MTKLNELNSELQGKDKDLAHMISTVKAFKAKVGLWTIQLRKGRLSHFPNLKRLAENVREADCFLIKVSIFFSMYAFVEFYFLEFQLVDSGLHLNV